MKPDSAKQDGKPYLLIVDDDELIRSSLAFVLRDKFSIRLAGSRSEAIEKFSELGRPRLILLDLGLPPFPHTPTEGYRTITDLLALDAEVPIVVLSGQDAQSAGKRSRILGAAEYVSKPVDPAEIQTLLLNLASIPSPTATPSYGLIGRSKAISAVRDEIRELGATSFPVLIQGESGTGKELVARAIHATSEHAAQPFVPINCSALAPNLFESLLFGHRKGAFTGATEAHPGYLSDAGAGTLFLDEIGDLALELQPKLLRVLERGEYQVLGESALRYSNARIIAATNRDLRSDVQTGKFRADLYFRLSALQIVIPPLRSRQEDVRLLLERFVSVLSVQTGKSSPVLADSASEFLQNYSFPGNIRELRNIALRLCIKYPGQLVEASEVAAETYSNSDDCSPLATSDYDPLTMLFVKSSRSSGLADILDPHRIAKEISDSKNFSLDARLREIELTYIEVAEGIAAGNLSLAARMLGISRTTLYSRLQSLKS